MSWDWEKLKEQQQKRGDIPPQMDDFLKRLNSFKLPGGPIIIILIIIALIGSTMFFTVQVDEVGMVQRFGKFNRKVQPGLHIKLPSGIEKVSKVKVKRVYNEEFGFYSMQSSQRGIGGADSVNKNVALMLTGDLNVALVPWIVQYKIVEPYNYLFKIHDSKQLLRDMSEAAMRLVVGDRSINEVISKREEIAEEAKKVLQDEMDNAETGIMIETIELKRTNVPEPVQSSFNEVNQATQEKEKLIYEANEKYNKAVPAAKGEAERAIKAAEGYAIDRVNRALGDAARFKALYHEYEKAKEITKKRLYLEMFKELFTNIGSKYIVDENQKSLLPLLDIGKQSGDLK